MFGITRLNTLSARPQVLATLGSIAITSTQNNNGSTNMTIPTGETGSLMVLFNTAQNNTTTAPTAPSWSGFTNIINTATTTSNPGARTYIAYKVLTATDTNGLTQLTMMTGTGFAPSQNSFYLIIRGYTGANSGDEIGNEQEDEDRRDIVSRIMKSRRLMDRNPRPA